MHSRASITQAVVHQPPTVPWEIALKHPEACITLEGTTAAPLSNATDPPLVTTGAEAVPRRPTAPQPSVQLAVATLTICITG